MTVSLCALLPFSLFFFLSGVHTHVHTHTHTQMSDTCTESLSCSFCCHPGEFTALAVLTCYPGCPCCVRCVSLSELFVCHSSLTALLLSPHGSLQATNRWSDFTSQAPVCTGYVPLQQLVIYSRQGISPISEITLFFLLEAPFHSSSSPFPYPTAGSHALHAV